MSLLAVASSLILLFTSKGEGSPETMAPQLWRQIATDYVGAKTAADGTALPSAAECRAKGAIYAVLATFDHIAVLPGGAARDPDRAYAVARFAVRNCFDGTDRPTKAVVLQSEPLESALLENDALGARVWSRPVRAALARDPLKLGVPASAAAATGSAVSRIIKVDADGVLIEHDQNIEVGQMLRVLTPAGTVPNDAVLLVTQWSRFGIRAIVIHAGAVPLKPGDVVAVRPN